MATAIKDVTPAEANAEMQTGLPYLDVRTPAEYAAGHAPGAINIPLMLSGPTGMAPNPEFMAQVTEKFTDVNTSIIVGCKSGARSMRACQAMSTNAPTPYTSLANVTGGFDAWAAAGLPVEK